MILAEAVNNKNNNLNAVKFVASMLVIISHAYGFAAGYERHDWLYMISGGSGDLGGLAVSIFFFFSGLLVTYSFLNNTDPVRFVKRRVKRIYPAFAIVTLAIVFLAGPVITNLSVKEYFTDMTTYKYLKNIIFLNEHNLPGVFGGNVYGTSVNGPIWTIRVEVFCYLMCYIFVRLGLITRNKKPIAGIVSYMFIVAVMGYLNYIGIDGVGAVILPVTMFFIGMMYAMYAEKICISPMLFAGCLTGFVIMVILNQFSFANIVFLPVLLCGCAFINKTSKLLDEYGKYSYEIYLWGGFVGQLVVFAFGGVMNEYLNMVVTIPIVIILGMLTNRIIISNEERV